MNKDELYDALVRLCQDYGITTEYTYERLHDAVNSIIVEDDEVR